MDRSKNPLPLRYCYGPEDEDQEPSQTEHQATSDPSYKMTNKSVTPHVPVNDDDDDDDDAPATKEDIKRIEKILEIILARLTRVQQQVQILFDAMMELTRLFQKYVNMPAAPNIKCNHLEASKNPLPLQYCCDPEDEDQESSQTEHQATSDPSYKVTNKLFTPHVPVNDDNDTSATKGDIRSIEKMLEITLAQLPIIEQQVRIIIGHCNTLKAFISEIHECAIYI